MLNAFQTFEISYWIKEEIFFVRSKRTAFWKHLFRIKLIELASFNLKRFLYMSPIPLERFVKSLENPFTLRLLRRFNLPLKPQKSINLSLLIMAFKELNKLVISHLLSKTSGCYYSCMWPCRIENSSNVVKVSCLINNNIRCIHSLRLCKWDNCSRCLSLREFWPVY